VADKFPPEAPTKPDGVRKGFSIPAFVAVDEAAAEVVILAEKLLTELRKAPLLPLGTVRVVPRPSPRKK
jgi:hypothetical protein